MSQMLAFMGIPLQLTSDAEFMAMSSVVAAALAGLAMKGSFLRVERLAVQG